MQKFENSKEKIIFTTPIIEYPAAGGPQLRIKNSIIALNSIAELHLLSRNSTEATGGEIAKKFYENNSFSYVNLTKYVNPENEIRSLLVRLYKKIFKKSDDDIYAKKIIDYANEQKINVIWFGYGNISYDLISKIKKNAKHLKLICDTDSVWSRFIRREVPYHENLDKKKQINIKADKKEAEERLLVQMCNVTTAVSNVDAAYYRSIADDPSRVFIFSNAIDENDYKYELPVMEKSLAPIIFLGGTFGHYDSPMDSAARWVLKEVMPLIHAKFSEAKLFLVGKGSDIGFGHIDDERIIATGRVNSVLPYLLRSSVSIVPLQFESGTRFKILESGICKVPIVSTTLGAEGIPVTNNKNIILADTPKAFAEGIIKFISDPIFSREVGENCFDLVRTQFGLSKLILEAGDILKAIKP